MNNQASENVSHTIDSNGNVVPRRYGVSRWSAPKFYKCTHEGCGYPSKILSTVGVAHNCCNTHEHEEGAQNEILHQ